MKKYYLLAIALIAIIIPAKAQSGLEGFNYQTIVRNTAGAPLVNTGVNFRFTLTNQANLVQYQETKLITTTSSGLANHVVGNGTVIQGTFATIPFQNADQILNVEVDITGGNTFQTVGTMTLRSVPYALFAASGNPGPQGPVGPQGAVGAAGPQGAVGPAGAVGAQGIQGDPGPQGAAGLQGAVGPAGLDGATGPMGPQGPTGLNGIDGINGLDGATGPMGPQGPAGNDGLDGATGPMGPQGPAGLNGIEGIDGLDGATGPMGLQGPAGPVLPFSGTDNDPSSSFSVTNNAGGIALKGISSNGIGLRAESSAGIALYAATETGVGMQVVSSDPSNSINAFESFHSGIGRAIYAKSTDGISGQIEIANATNNSDALVANTAGAGAAVFANSTQGIAGVFQNINTLNSNNTISVSTSGSGYVASFESTNTTSATKGLLIKTTADMAGNAVNIANGTIAISSQNDYVGADIDDGIVIVQPPNGNSLTLPSIGANGVIDGMTIWVVNHTGQVLTITNCIESTVATIADNSAKQFLITTKLSSTEWIPVQ